RPAPGDRLAAAGAVDEPARPGDRRLPDDLLHAVGHRRRAGRAALDVDLQPRVRHRQQPAGRPRDQRPAVALQRELGHPRVRDHERLEHRRADGRLPGRAAGHPAAPLRGGRDRRGRSLGEAAERDLADDLADRLLQRGDEDHQLLPDLHTGLRDDQRRAGQRQPVHRPVPLQQRVPAVPDGLRGRARLARVHDHPGADAPGHPHVALLGLLRGRRRRSDVAAPMATITRTEAPPRQPAAATRSPNRFLLGKRFRGRAQVTIATTLVVLGAFVVLVPFFWMVSTSVKSDGEVFLVPIRWIPRRLQLQNYALATTVIPFWQYAINSVHVTVLVVLGAVGSSSLVAYAFARLRARLRSFLFIVLLSRLMLPSEVTLVSTYLIFKNLGWVDTYNPLIVPAYFGNAFYIFMLRQFYLTLPVELDRRGEDRRLRLFRHLRPHHRAALQAGAGHRRHLLVLRELERVPGAADLPQHDGEVHAAGRPDVLPRPVHG